MRENHRKAPLFEALTDYHAWNPHPFHIPGHKRGQGFDREGASWFHPLLLLDATEVSNLDDLHHPEGAIAEAQRLAADAFRADETFFLVGGSTAGNIAMIMAVCQPGDVLIVQRNVHKSVIHGLMLARVNPIFIAPRMDRGSGIATGVTPEQVKEALYRYPEAKGVLLTNPNYYGLGVNLSAIAQVVHEYGIPLLVDEAHGAHFGFHPLLPASAMDQGADAAVQSTHKMLPAMTMSSMLHVQGEFIDRYRLRRALTMIQSSSPSYPLMASLDLARRYMVLEGMKSLDIAIAYSDQIKTFLTDHLPWMSYPSAMGVAFESIDPLKIILCAHKENQHVGRSGYKLQEQLVALRCVPEMADPQHVVLALSVGTLQSDIDGLLHALQTIDQKLLSGEAKAISPNGKRGTFPLPENLFITKLKLAPYEVMDARIESVSLTDAEGRVSGESIIPYPPGIPILMPGEEIDRAVLKYIQELQRSGARFQGLENSQAEKIRVVVE